MPTLPIWSGGLQDVIEHPGIDLAQDLQLIIPTQHLVAIDGQPIPPHSPESKISSAQSAQIKIINNQRQRNVAIQLLSPPIMISLRDEQYGDGNDYQSRLLVNNGKMLSKSEINYFKNRGSNATLFIHGYNVAYGKFGPKADNVVLDPSTLMLNLPAIFITGQGDSTVYRDINILRNAFPQIPDNVTSINGCADLEIMLNGSEAHNWLIRMEDNLNRATRAFNRDNYLKFERIINISWSGDPFPLDYVDAIRAISDPKIKPAQRLADVIFELKEAGVNAINIIAHSLGNGLLVKTMEYLGEKNQNIIAHAFLWQPAIPDNVFSLDSQTHDPSYYFDPALDPWYVPHAYRSAQKISILYSFNDNILGPLLPNQANQAEIENEKSVKELWSAKALSPFGLSLYLLSSWIGVPPSNLINSYARQKYYLTWISVYPATIDGHVFDKNFANEISYWTSKDYNSLTKIIDQVSLASHNILTTIMPFINELFTLAKVVENSPYRPNAAMGYSGPEMNSALMKNMLASGKLINIDQTQWLWDHSAMRIPTDQIMQNSYEKHIIGGDGTHAFGLYDIG